MANKNLSRRLRREMTANPKKAAVLGLLLLVAVWFWAPLLGKWFGKKSTGAEAPIAAASLADGVVQFGTGTTTSSTSAATTAAESGKAKLPTWQQVTSWIRNDPKMKPHMPSVGERDPFGSAVARVTVGDDKPKDVAPEPPPELTPHQAGITLGSTVFGSARRTALINGRAFREQQTVMASNGRDRFVLAEIRKTSIVLERAGQRFELKLPTVEVDTPDDLTSTTDPPSPTTDH